MRTRNLVILLVAAVAMVAIWQARRAPRGKSAEFSGVIPKFSRNQVGCIMIETPGTSVTLTRKSERWYCDTNGRLRADADAIRRVLDGVENMPPAKVISKDPAMHTEFKVDKATGWRVRMLSTNGARLFDVMIGKRPPQEVRATYVRPSDSNVTYQAPRDLTLLFDRPEGWRNKLLFEVKLEELSRIQIETTTYTIALAPKPSPGKQESGASAATAEAVPWVIVQPIHADARSEIMDRLSNMLLYFAAFGLEDNVAGVPLSEFGLNPAYATITFARGESSNGAIVLTIGEQLHEEESPRARYAMVSGDPQIYILREETLSVFFLNPSEMKK
ncbi:MAG: DUF4340 domain-containing protein [Candidatus Sumerlaeota bacterium]|nr:DUF4340 domain-containing protein [Candidatus Sumerlaeota bacterium]